MTAQELRRHLYRCQDAIVEAAWLLRAIAISSALSAPSLAESAYARLQLRRAWQQAALLCSKSRRAERRTVEMETAP